MQSAAAWQFLGARKTELWLLDDKALRTQALEHHVEVAPNADRDTLISQARACVGADAQAIIVVIEIAAIIILIIIIINNNNNKSSYQLFLFSCIFTKHITSLIIKYIFLLYETYESMVSTAHF